MIGCSCCGCSNPVISLVHVIESVVGVFKLSYPPGQPHKQVTLLTKSSGQDSLGLLCSVGISFRVHHIFAWCNEYTMKNIRSWCLAPMDRLQPSCINWPALKHDAPLIISICGKWLCLILWKCDNWTDIPGRKDTRLDRLNVKRMADVYNSNRIVHRGNIAVVCMHRFVSLYFFFACMCVSYTTRRPLRPIVHLARTISRWVFHCYSDC